MYRWCSLLTNLHLRDPTGGSPEAWKLSFFQNNRLRRDGREKGALFYLCSSEGMKRTQEIHAKSAQLFGHNIFKFLSRGKNNTYSVIDGCFTLRLNMLVLPDVDRSGRRHEDQFILMCTICGYCEILAPTRLLENNLWIHRGHANVGCLQLWTFIDERSRPHYETLIQKIRWAVTYQSQAALQVKRSYANSMLLLCLARRPPGTHHLSIPFRAEEEIYHGIRKDVAFLRDDEPRVREQTLRLRLCCCYR